jgi:NlpC/P60 family putative phage cell wall peptidase
MTTRTEVVAAARSWIGTPFAHQARLKGVGVDCIGLVIGVGRELGFCAPDFDVSGYARNPDGKSLMALSRVHMSQISREAMQPGDVVVVRFGDYPQHFGVLADYKHGGLSIVHAAMKSGAVVEQRLMFSNAMHFVAAFAMPGVE